MSVILRHMTPHEKQPRWPVTETGTDGLVPRSHSRSSLHQPQASVSSVSMRWFT